MSNRNFWFDSDCASAFFIHGKSWQAIQREWGNNQEFIWRNGIPSFGSEEFVQRNFSWTNIKPTYNWNPTWTNNSSSWPETYRLVCKLLFFQKRLQGTFKEVNVFYCRHKRSLRSFWMCQHFLMDEEWLFLMGRKFLRVKEDFGLSRERGRWDSRWKTTNCNRIPESQFLDSRQLNTTTLLIIWMKFT